MTNKEWYEKRKSEHRCVTCGKQDSRTLSGLVYCAECNTKRTEAQRKYRREISDYDKKVRQIRKKEGLCIQCGKEDAYTMAGRSRCADCAEKMREADKRRYKKDGKKRNDQAYQQRIERGLCVRCGKHPVPPGRRICDLCVKQTQRNTRKRFIEQGGNWPRGENGICWTCNKEPVIPGQRVCAACYEKVLAAQKKADEWHKENGYGPFAEGVRAFWELKRARKLLRNTTPMAVSNPMSGEGNTERSLPLNG